MRWLLALVVVLSLLVVACGGGGGDDDDDDDAGDASPTRSAAASSTSAASPTRAASPQATSAGADGSPTVGGGIGTGGGRPPAATTTAATGDLTPTSRPLTVVSSPRPIAQRTPTRGAIEVPTATAEGGDLDVIVEESFDSPDSTAFFTGTSDFGTTATIADGWYQVVVPELAWQVLDAGATDGLADGVILTDVALEGDGSAGLAARVTTFDDGSYAFLLCWLDTRGDAGCHENANGEWIELFRLGEGAVEVLEVNRLLLSIAGSELYFEINDVEVGTASSEAVTAGTWGVYGESYSGTMTLYFDAVLIADASQ